MKQGPGQGKTLLHPFAICSHLLVSAVGQLEGFQQILNPTRHPVLGDAVQLSIDLQVVPSCQALVQRRGLGQDPRAPAERGTIPQGIKAQHTSPAAIRRQHPVEQTNSGRLARAVVPQNAKHLASVHIERQAIDGHHVPEAAAETVHHDNRLSAHTLSFLQMPIPSARWPGQPDSERPRTASGQPAR